METKFPFDQQQVVDELTAACNSLGKVDENDGTYMKHRDCKPCLKEIQRFLIADSKNHVARTTLGALNVVKSDLIPILNQYCDFDNGDLDLFTIVLRLCSNLTSSILLLFENQEIPNDPETAPVVRKLLNSLYGYKEAFASDEKIWKTLNKHLKNTEDEISFERLIILIRNILHIPVDSTADMGIHNDFDAHEMCLYQMDKSGMFSTLIEIASDTQRGTEFCFHITEIVYLMLRDKNPATIAAAKSNTNKRKLDDDDPDRKRYLELSARNRREREAKKAKLAPSRFKNSAFFVQNCRSLSDAPLILRNPLDCREDLKFDVGKTELRKSKNKKPLASETSSIVISDRNTKPSRNSYSLKIFCKRFVEKVYANYMQQIKHNLIQKRAAENDESYYLWAVQFFTAFNRHLYLSMDNISETLSTSTLHFIQILITSYQDKLKVEKNRNHQELVSKRLHLAIRVYREILYLIKSVQPDSEFWTTIENIKKKTFTELEYSTLLVTLFQQYDEPKHSPEYLRDLIKTNHIFLELFEDYAKTHNPVEIEAEENFEDEIENKPEIESEPKPDKPRKKRKRKKKKLEFRAVHFMTRYCSPEVIKSYLDVLKHFKTNEDEINLAILKFYERIVYDCHYEVMLLQVSVLKCLIAIMNDHSSMPGHAGFVELGKHLMRHFGSMANKKRWMFQELLFWKTTGDVLEIENAVDPPPIAVVPDDGEDLPKNDNEMDEVPIDTGETANEEQPPGNSLDDLLAELSSDSSDHEEEDNIVDITLKATATINNSGEDSNDSIDELMAKLDDNPVSDSELGLPDDDSDYDDAAPTQAVSHRLRLSSSPEDQGERETDEIQKSSPDSASNQLLYSPVQLGSSSESSLPSPPAANPTDSAPTLSDIPAVQDAGSNSEI